MKYMKKLSALLLALVMVFSLTVGASAAEANLDNHTYKAYQIFTGTQAVSAANLGNIEWGSGVNYSALLSALKADDTLGTTFANCESAADVAAAMQNWADKSENAKSFAAIAYNHIITTPEDKGIACENGTTTLDAGYYLIVDTTSFGEDATDTVYNTALLQMTQKGTFVIENKTDVPEVEKKIVEGTEKVDVNEAGIGESVKYEITGTLPSNIADYKEYFYRFTDTLSKGLTYNDDMVITVNGKDVTKYFYKNATEYSETTGTTITVAIQDLLALENLTDPAVGTITKDTKIVLTYSATVNEHAEINAANPNNVDLEYSNNPNDSGEGTTTPPPENPSEPAPTKPTGKTPKDEVETYVTEVHINKVDGKNNPLNGAEFEISGTSLKKIIVKTEEFTEDAGGTYYKLKDGTYTTEAPKTDDESTEDVNEDNTAYYESTTTKYKMEVKSEVKEVAEGVTLKSYVDANGKLTFSGLGEGEYTIKETTTPAGYNTISDITLKVEFDEASKTFTYTWSGGATGNTNTINVVNQAGSTLPETGGMGTTLFYIVGGILVLAAVVLLVTKKRMSSAE